MLRQITAGQEYFRQHPFIKSLYLPLLSSLLLILAFPQTSCWILAWVGLIPLMSVIDGKKAMPSFFFGYLSGIFFFLGTIYWFIHVTLLGMILLVLYLAVYFALFAWGYALSAKRNLLEKLFLLPSIWVTLEFIKGHLLSGFGWVSLGQSQYKVLPLIQIADITGMFGVSFLIVMANVLIKELIGNKFRFSHKEFLYPFLTFLIILILTLGYGFYKLNNNPVSSSVKVAIIQANIPQESKWEPSAWPSIMKEYLTLTQEAAKEKPDLILWPETAFPGFVWEAPELFIKLKDFTARLNIPLLLGLVTQIDDAYYNSAVLISKDGDIIDQYDKLHLVPFGEYIPLRKIFPFLESIVPIGDFTAGKKYTLFPAFPDNERKKEVFSVLICFEDTVPEISRRFVAKGSNLLVNITNDAWFQNTKAPFIHLLASVFRSIENRRPLIRSTNTGVSCFVDKNGRITKYVRGRQRISYVKGYAIEDVFFSDEKTFYTKFGDVFTYLCFGSILIAVVKRRNVK